MTLVMASHQSFRQWLDAWSVVTSHYLNQCWRNSMMIYMSSQCIYQLELKHEMMMHHGVMGTQWLVVTLCFIPTDLTNLLASMCFWYHSAWWHHAQFSKPHNLEADLVYFKFWLLCDYFCVCVSFFLLESFTMKLDWSISHWMAKNDDTAKISTKFYPLITGIGWIGFV